MRMNCLIVDDEEISRKILERFVAQTDSLKLAGSCENAIDAVNILKTKDVDLIFLDIEMPEMTGIELIETLKVNPQIIFVTAKEDYAVEAFEHNVTDYLLKPLTYARFLKSVNKAQDNIKQHLSAVSPGYIFIKVESRLLRLNLSDIDYVEAHGDYIQLHTKSGKHMIYSTMKHIEANLPREEFTRVHRSFIVRMDRIADITEHNLMIDKHIIPIGAMYKNDLLKKLNIL
jgi:DNA-binding LytR/AlgR family response regulator